MHELGKLLFGINRLDSGRVVLADGTEITSPETAVDHRMAYMSKNRDTEAVILNYKIGDQYRAAYLEKAEKRPVYLQKRRGPSRRPMGG